MSLNNKNLADQIHYVFFFLCALLFPVNTSISLIKKLFILSSSFHLLPWLYLLGGLPTLLSLLHIPHTEPGHLSAHCSTIVLSVSVAVALNLQLCCFPYSFPQKQKQTNKTMPLLPNSLI